MKKVLVLSVGLILAVLAAGLTARADGWSWLNPFSSKTDQKKSLRPTMPPKPTHVFPKLTKPEPSAWDKLGTNTQQFVNGIGNTLSPSKATNTSTQSKKGTSP